MSSFRVRFAPVKPSDPPEPAAKTPLDQQPEANLGRRRPKSHQGCRECKTRRVKCDETVPVCLRCQKRGSLCFSSTRSATWQFEMPWLAARRRNPAPPRRLEVHRLDQLAHVNKRLLERWFERTAFILVLDPETNPLSFPIIFHLASSPSLVHALQSITAGHETFFEGPRLHPCLEERGKTLATFRQELAEDNTPLPLRFWTCYLLGVSASYIDQNRFDYGREHLLAAHKLVTSILSSKASRDTEFTNNIMGAYVYWDLSCSTLIEPAEQPPRDPLVLEHVHRMKNFNHPTTGCFTDLFYLLGDVGRYSRMTVDGFPRDLVFERVVEQKLTVWDIASDDQHWQATADMFRMHGLILLYRICEHPPARMSPLEDESVSETPDSRRNRRSRELALHIIRLALKIPPTSNFVTLQPTTLLTAGGELRLEDSELRDSVRSRLREVFSYNHLPGSVWALRLLEEVWSSNDHGNDVHWLKLMLEKKWRLRLE